MLSYPTELQTYEQLLPSLLSSDDGKYVVIKGQELCGVFASYEVALTWAYEHFGLAPFFVKQISAELSIAHFSRDFGLCAA